MQPKVIQTSNTKKNKEKNETKKSITIINTIFANNNEMSKHKSQEIYAQYSPSNLNNNNNNNNNNPTLNNNSKKNTTLANTIKQIIHYSDIKKGTNSNNIGANKNQKDKDASINENRKQKSSKDYTNININDINSKQEENVYKKIKRNNLDNILSESDSCQEIDSMEEDSLSKGNRIKSVNVNLKNLNNINNMNFKKHLTTGFNNKSNNLQEHKNSITTFTKQKTAKEKKTKNMNINTNNEDTEEEIIINDNNEFDNSKSMQNNKLNETKFPKLSTNPFTNENNLSENNNDLCKKSTSSKVTNKNNNKLKNVNNKKKEIKENKENKENEKIIFSNHHIKSSTLGTIKQSSTNQNSSSLSNAVEIINISNNLTKKENNEINKNNNNSIINQNANAEHLYRNLLLMSKKGDRENFLEILEKIFSLPNNLININYQDDNGFSALHYACDEGNLKIVEILLKANCETNIKNNEKKTPLHLASKRGYFDISKKLIENGALLNIYDSEKNSPIHYVCMFNHIELLKFFLAKLPQADEKNIYGKMPIDLTDNIEMKNILENYLKNNENSYHKIRIYQTSDSKMKNMIESFPPGEEIDEDEFPQSRKHLSNKNNLNMNITINTSNLKNNKNSSLSPSPNKNNPRTKLKNRKQDFNSIQPKSNIIKKNTLNMELQNSHNLNFDINKSPHLNSSNVKINHNNTINAKANVNSVLKHSELKTSIKLKENKQNHNSNIKNDNTHNHNKKHNNKILIQDTNSNSNKTSKNISGLKKTKTVEQFSTKTSSKNNLYKINLMNSNKPKQTLNESRMNKPNYCQINLNINNSINNGVNRINISFNNKNEFKKLNKSITKFDKDIKKKGTTNSENKNKLIENNLKHKKMLLDSIESNNNIINLNKTEENNLSKISKKSLNKIKNVNISINLNSSKTLNTNDYNTIKIVENKEINLSKGKNKHKNKNIKNKKKENQKNKDNKDNNNENNNNINNINLENCNISKISCGPQIFNNNNMLDSINKTNIIDQTLADNFHAQLNLNSIEEERITPSSFICLAQLGKGSFGEVYLVQKINTQEKFAMKVLRKERIMGQNLMKYAIAERNVLSLSNHPFIVKLNFAFQTSSKLFLILEYCPNGDLAKHLLFEKRFTEERAKFYICEILLALENLHQRDIIFRDLKPDNVVLDEEGHCKLTDFGLSKEGVNENQSAKSFCGSIAYLAPEMLKKQGHGKAVDWYLLGVLFYEMIVGITPFFTNRKEDIFHNIEYGELKIPEFVSPQAASLIRGLLQKDPNKRLGGSIKDAQEIKEHPYFKDVDWDMVYNKKITPPPFNIFTNKIMHIYHRPRLFANDDNLNRSSDKQNPNMLPGWSFVNNEES